MNHCVKIRYVDLRPLKAFVLKSLSDTSMLKNIIVRDNDFVNATEFVIKVRIWLMLLQLEFNKG
jgi:hypothetical protein